MESADLRGADLSNANLDNADLKGARLEGAILRGAQAAQRRRNLTQAQVDRAQGDESTTLPPKLRIPEDWLSDPKSRVSRLEQRTSRRSADLKADLYAALGVKRGASPRAIRAAYLRLVKDLHPDGSSSIIRLRTKRLKAVNRAYHDLKELEKRAAGTRVSGPPQRALFLRSSRIDHADADGPSEPSMAPATSSAAQLVRPGRKGRACV